MNREEVARAGLLKAALAGKTRHEQGRERPERGRHRGRSRLGEVEDIDGALAELKAKGVKLRDETPRIGHGGARIAFIDPSSTGDVLIELAECRPATAPPPDGLPVVPVQDAR